MQNFKNAVHRCNLTAGWSAIGMQNFPRIIASPKFSEQNLHLQLHLVYEIAPPRKSHLQMKEGKRQVSFKFVSQVGCWAPLSCSTCAMWKYFVRQGNCISKSNFPLDSNQGTGKSNQPRIQWARTVLLLRNKSTHQKLKTSVSPTNCSIVTTKQSLHACLHVPPLLRQG